MKSETQQIIDGLKTSELYAECYCGEEFRLSDVILFDGTKPFPPEVIEIQEQYEEGLKEREATLKKDRKLATEKSLITTRAVNIGRNLEKVLPLMDDFKWQIPDCRFLGDPIDLLTFNGLSENNVESISFIEVKSGKAKLNPHQKLVKEAVEDHRVKYKVF